MEHLAPKNNIRNRQIAFMMIMFLLISTQATFSQARTYGSIVNDSLLKIKAMPEFQGFAVDAQPAYSLKKFCPSPLNQGQIGSCTGWAIGYGILTIKNAIYNNLESQQQIDESAFSSMFVFNHIKIQNGCQSTDICNACGSSFTDAINFLTKYGNIPHNQVNDFSCNGNYPDELWNKARASRITSSSTVFNTFDPEYAFSGDSRIKRVADQILSNNPVFISIFLPQKTGDLTFFSEKMYFQNGWWVPPPYATPNRNFSHAMVVVGYDLDKGYFELLNSWGNDWADNGFCKISFNDFLKYVVYAGVMYNTPASLNIVKPLVDVKLQAFKRVEGVVQQEANDLPVKFNGKYYEATLANGQLFKINLSHLPNNYYAYVMSYDANKKAQVHFPHTNENPYIYKNNLSYVIPQKSVLAFNQKSDHIIILLSQQPIPDFETKFLSAMAHYNSQGMYQYLLSSFDAQPDVASQNFNTNQVEVNIPDTQKPVLLYINLQQT
jgi:hypothetical protein